MAETKKSKAWWAHPATPGVLLLAATVAAMVAANTETRLYDAMLETMAVVGIGDWSIQKPLLLWINDGLMAVFFLLVGLELKREVLFGSLADKRKLILPLAGAIGGIAVPSSIYAAVNWAIRLR